MDENSCSRVISIIEYAYNNISDNQSSEWLNWCTRYIKLYNKIVNKVENRSIGQKHRILYTIPILKTYFENFKQRQHRQGGAVGLSRRRINDRVQWKDLDSVFNGRIRTGVIVNLRHKDLRSFLQDSKSLTVIRLKNALQRDGNLKVNGVLACKFRALKNDEVIEETKFFNTKNKIILSSADMKLWFDENLTDRLLRKVEDCQKQGSGSTLIQIFNLTVNINRYAPLQGALSTFVKLPQDIQNKKAVVNVKNTDEYCFL